MVEVTPTTVVDDDEAGERQRDMRGRGRLDDAAEPLREGKDGEAPPPARDDKEADGQRRAGKTRKQKKLSPAERRRQIKEELQRLAQGEKRGVYQPRLW